MFFILQQQLVDTVQPVTEETLDLLARSCLASLRDLAGVCFFVYLS